MRMSDNAIERQITALEAKKGLSAKLRKEVEDLDIRDHIAECYFPVHEDVTRGDHTFINLPGGRGSGKSSFVALEIVNLIMKDQSGQGNALIIRKYANTLRGSVFNQIQWAINTLGVSNLWKSTVVPMEFVYKTGQVIRFSGLDDPGKLKSLKPSKGYFSILWIEEFSEITGEPELRNLQETVLRGGSRFSVFRSFNPPISSASWVNQFVEREDERSLTFRTDYRMIPAEWLGEVFLGEAERLKAINPKAYDHEFLGLPVGNGSEVFPNLEIRTITDEEIRNQDYIFQGLDFGFSSDPFAFVRLAYDRKTDTILFLDEIYRRGCSNKMIADEIKGKGYDRSGSSYVSPLFGTSYETKQIVVCDCAEPKSIADLNDNGLKAHACHKEPGCVQYRTKWLQHRRIVIDPARTPESAKEFRNYCYVVDRKTGEITSELPDANNHTIDATAYALDRLIYYKGISA